MNIVSHLLELLPVFLALLAAVMCSARYKVVKNKADKAVLALGVASACLLIVAQTSWWGTYILTGDLKGTVWANHIWTLFNSLTMLAFIVFSRGRNA